MNIDIGNNALAALVVVALLTGYTIRTLASRPKPITRPNTQALRAINEDLARLADEIQRTTRAIPTYDPSNIAKQNGHSVPQAGK